MSFMPSRTYPPTTLSVVSSPPKPLPEELLKKTIKKYQRLLLKAKKLSGPLKFTFKNDTYCYITDIKYTLLFSLSLTMHPICCALLCAECFVDTHVGTCVNRPWAHLRELFQKGTGTTEELCTIITNEIDFWKNILTLERAKLKKEEEETMYHTVGASIPVFSSWLVLELNLEEIHKLVEAKIPVIPTTIEMPVKLEGSAFPVEHKTEVIKIMGFEDCVSEEITTNKEGISFLAINLTLPPGPPPAVAHKVIIRRWEGYGQSSFQKIIESTLLPFIQKDVVVHVPHGVPHSLINDGKFYVWIWSSPVGSRETRQTRVPETLWGNAVSCRDSGFNFSGIGSPITDGDYIVAEYVENNLYIHYDICHHGRKEELKIFEHICKEVQILYDMTSEERIKQNTFQAQENYIKLCSKRQEVALADLKANISGAQSDIEAYQKQLIKSITNLEKHKTYIKGFTSIDEEKKEEVYTLEYSKIHNMVGVSHVIAVANIIKVFTEQINIPYGGELYDIGKFIININISGEIQIHNIINKCSGYDHPHISNGSCCFGNLSTGIAKLIGEYQFAPLVQILLQYLNTIYPGDWHTSIENWPKVKVVE